eukprot:COSAG02_NODE_3582_length_6531_cov_4.696206_8_plen_98_part_00
MTGVQESIPAVLKFRTFSKGPQYQKDHTRGAHTSLPQSLCLRNRGDWRSIEPSGLGPEYRVVALLATLTYDDGAGAVSLLSLMQGLSFRLRLHAGGA